MNAAIAVSGDVFLIFSSTGQPQSLVNAAELARSRGAIIVSVTRGRASAGGAQRSPEPRRRPAARCISTIFPTPRDTSRCWSSTACRAPDGGYRRAGDRHAAQYSHRHFRAARVRSSRRSRLRHVGVEELPGEFQRAGADAAIERNHRAVEHAGLRRQMKATRLATFRLADTPSGYRRRMRSNRSDCRQGVASSCRPHRARTDSVGVDTVRPVPRPQSASTARAPPSQRYRPDSRRPPGRKRC